MSINWVGLAAAAAAFFGIWIGHVGVRKIEAVSTSLWPPTIGAVLLGLALEAGALSSSNQALSAALGILGMTALWDALEFWRQHHRIARGHAPANPANPRHARLLASGTGATRVDWLKREPVGRPVTVAEALRLLSEREAQP